MSTKHILTCIHGSIINFSDIESSEIYKDDIVHRLSNIVRFNGGTNIPYTVMHHTVALYNLIKSKHPENYVAQLYALMHDTTEAFMGDMVSPLKSLFPGFSMLEDKLLKEIYRQLMIDMFYPDEATIALVKEEDLKIAYAEWVYLNGNILYDQASAWGAIYGGKMPGKLEYNTTFDVAQYPVGIAVYDFNVALDNILKCATKDSTNNEVEYSYERNY